VAGLYVHCKKPSWYTKGTNFLGYPNDFSAWSQQRRVWWKNIDVGQNILV